jgi:DNA-binding LytR/AlgR family response regulator
MSLGDNRYWERIPIEEIAAVASEGNYSCVHTLDGSNFFIRRTMQEWRTRLTPAGFVGLSRSLLIQPAAILRLEVISRNETMIHLYGVPAPFRLGRTASLRARRYPLG